MKMISFPQAAIKIAGWALFLCVAGYTGVYGMATARLFSGVNVRETASEWIEQNIPKGSTVGVIQYECYLPAILRAYETPYKIVTATDERNDGKHQGSSVGLDLPILRLHDILQKTDFLVMTEHEYIFYNDPRLAHLFPEQAKALKDLFNEAEEAARFQKDAEFMGFRFPKKLPPLEWMNANGTILILRKKAV